MNNRVLGSTGLIVSEVGFGGWQLCSSDSGRHMNDRTAIRLIEEALEGGINLFDTAPNYAETKSEQILGKALRNRRNDVVLVSKFGHSPDGHRDFSVDCFWDSLEGSLGRLQTDYLDVLLLHNPPNEIYSGTDPLWSALEDARMQGKIRHYGASLDFASEVEDCLAYTKSEVLEVLFNVFHQDVRQAFATVRERNAGIISKVPLDSGWLTGRFDSNSRFVGVRSRWSIEEIAQRAALVSQISWLIEDKSELAHKAIAYLLSYEEVCCVIPGIRTPQQLESNLAASSYRLGPEERKRLETFWNHVTENGSKLLPW